MKCYRCNSRLASDRNVCPKCGADVRLYRKIIYTSNQYYNLGLTRAKARDLTGAAECLRTSLQLNKRNINARNLLGLVYLEMGEAALALKEWVISKNFRHRGNLADAYITDMRENRQALDSADHSVRKFNQALEYARAGSRDLAVIQLKKVIAVNPRMIKAYLLLALMYMDDQKYDQAKAVVNKCLEIDRGNPQAMSYQRELAKYKTTKKENIGVAGELEREEVIIPVRMRDYGSYLSSAMYILIGFILALGVLYYVIMPSKEAEFSASNTAVIQDYEDRCLALKADISELESQVEALEGERDSLTENMNESSEEAGALKNAYETILNAAQYYVTGDFVTFADVFPTIDQAMSEDPTYQAMYALMKADYDTNLTTRLYMMAVTYREQNQDRQSAITICDKILSIDPNYDAALFYKALCYEETGDTGTAQTLYLEYLTGFPAGIWTQEVRNRMSAIAPAVLQMFDSGQITAGTVLPGITP
ncbi:MAG: tetratricopeptide repeat protein [Lachnospiraceae bacterium]|nr:tetratricopeptide repeat protein [Lachnospiraceae bacterium]